MVDVSYSAEQREAANRLDAAPNLASVFFDRSDALLNRAAYRKIANADGIEHVPLESDFHDFLHLAYNTAGFLAKVGIAPGERVAIMSGNRPEWMIADFGIHRAGGVLVPCYTSDPPDRIAYVLRDADVKAVFVENQEQLDHLMAALEPGMALPNPELGVREIDNQFYAGLKKIILFEDVHVEPRLSHLVERFPDALESSFNPPRFCELNAKITRSSESSIIYTSGTTGTPKGVVAEQGQTLANIRQIVSSGLTDNLDSSFQLLPLSHGFGQMLMNATAFAGATALFHRIPNRKNSQLTEEAKAIVRADLPASAPEMCAVVPAVLKAIKDRIELRASAWSIEASVLRRVVDYCISEYERKLEVLGDMRPKLRIFSQVTRRLAGALEAKITKKIREAAVGPNLRFFISGGGALPVEQLDFIQALKIAPVYEGYGSTESNVPTHVNTPNNYRRGTVGKPLDASISQFVEDGLLVIAGDNIARGYLNRPDATQKAFGVREDGTRFFRTPDRASIDQDGFLKVHGRIDDIIALSSGQKVDVTPIEQKLRQMRNVIEATIVGKEDFLVGFVTVDNSWFAEGMDERRTSLQAEIHKELIRQIMSFTKERERPVRVVAIPQPEMGEGLTNKRTLQRWKIAEMYAHELTRESRPVAVSQYRTA